MRCMPPLKKKTGSTTFSNRQGRRAESQELANRLHLGDPPGVTADGAVCVYSKPRRPWRGTLTTMVVGWPSTVHCLPSLTDVSAAQRDSVLRQVRGRKSPLCGAARLSERLVALNARRQAPPLGVTDHINSPAPMMQHKNKPPMCTPRGRCLKADKCVSSKLARASSTRMRQNTHWRTNDQHEKNANAKHAQCPEPFWGFPRATFFQSFCSCRSAPSSTQGPSPSVAPRPGRATRPPASRGTTPPRSREDRGSTSYTPARERRTTASRRRCTAATRRRRSPSRFDAA
mmetsp:Transcript_73882/g.204717  ORF Transcript_73882/g.204717 Transcript_73882/m.204717 type:complete len:287 (+) Transcript_73882:149-1009(+)